VDVELVGLLHNLVRLETELWNRVELTVQPAHGVPLDLQHRNTRVVGRPATAGVAAQPIQTAC
jgi:hypothetical protein